MPCRYHYHWNVHFVMFLIVYCAFFFCGKTTSAALNEKDVCSLIFSLDPKTTPSAFFNRGMDKIGLTMSAHRNYLLSTQEINAFVSVIRENAREYQDDESSLTLFYFLSYERAYFIVASIGSRCTFQNSARLSCGIFDDRTGRNSRQLRECAENLAIYWKAEKPMIEAMEAMDKKYKQLHPP